MHQTDHQEAMRQARRKFLTTCGKFAVVTPPAITLLLSAANRSYAQAASGGPGPTGGRGDSDNDEDDE